MSNNDDIIKQVADLKRRVEMLEADVKNIRKLAKTIVVVFTKNFNLLCMAFKSFLDDNFKERK